MSDLRESRSEFGAVAGFVERCAGHEDVGTGVDCSMRELMRVVCGGVIARCLSPDCAVLMEADDNEFGVSSCVCDPLAIAVKIHGDARRGEMKLVSERET